MTPTAKLRFFEKTVHFNSGSTTGDGIPIIGTQKFRVLQQWWEMKEFICDEMRVTGGEWRDVPLETEE